METKRSVFFWAISVKTAWHLKYIYMIYNQSYIIMNLKWYIYTMNFYAAERKKELIPFATAWMELESIMLSEISQVVRNKYHMISPLTGT